MNARITDYTTNKNNTARFTLGKYCTKPLVFLGINPSVATKEKNDNTISIVEKIAEKNGYDGYLMLNIYPIRATKIDDTFDTVCNVSVSDENIKYIFQKVKEGTDIVAAWGTHICDREYFVDILSKINKIVKDRHARWIVLSTTKYGHPHHPTRLAYEKMTLEEFDMDKYIKSFAIE